ncbi:MAG TPA: response regulator transcription factor [Ginsengibacter sp.]|nr:response regulator transcription factor [Chitinophagaceae bacterium]HRN71820.1 response regulator transcription factor [Ginsengibacter sp.]HRP16356.1 response regulator transcription factor [Ginsengibacter sp.]HRP43654.1 response regulator transcription factor [Ginsengibacter sp.]
MTQHLCKVALVDDHELLRAGLARIIDKFDGYKVILEAGNGKEFIDSIDKNNIPDVVLLDISMPVMDGYETAEWIGKNHPDLKILVLSMLDNESAIIKMIRLGASGYILKDSKPVILKEAFDTITTSGFYSNDLVSSQLFYRVKHQRDTTIEVTEKEKEFLRYACTEMTYKEIAEKMFISSRTVENYRDALYEKFDIKSRVGLVLFAIKEHYCKL